MHKSLKPLTPAMCYVLDLWSVYLEGPGRRVEPGRLRGRGQPTPVVLLEGGLHPCERAPPSPVVPLEGGLRLCGWAHPLLWSI